MEQTSENGWGEDDWDVPPQASTTAKPVASYMRVTKASEARARSIRASSIVHRRLPIRSEIRKASLSSWAAIPASQGCWPDSDEFTTDVEGNDDARKPEPIDTDETLGEIGSVAEKYEAHNEESTDLRPVIDPNSYQGLEQRWGVNNHKIRDSAHGQCYIPIKRKTQLLSSALRLCQKVVWDFANRHWPEFRERHWIEGPEEVEFGREHLTLIFSDGLCPQDTTACGESWHRVFHSMLNVVGLRNQVAHPRFMSPISIDTSLCDAVRLAIAFKDHDRIKKAARLRELLYVAAERSLGDIKEQEPLMAEPDATPWARHHQRLFKHAKSRMQHDAPHLYQNLPEVVKKIAIRDFGAILNHVESSPTAKETTW